VIVGQARSGSTLITRLMADTRHFFLVNDAYFLQMADDLCASPTPENRLRLAEACLGRMRQRALTDEVRTVNRSVRLSSADFDDLQAALPGIASEADTAWEVIFRLVALAAERAGAKVWGWNSPQDYVHAQRLLTIRPESRVVFLIRNPYSVLKSYKNLPRYWGAERNRYHPLAQSLVWKAVVREYERLAALFPGRLALVRYEDLIVPQSDVWERLADILGPFPAPQPANAYDRNSSHASSQGLSTTKPLSRVEIGICRAVTSPLAGRLGYEAEGKVTQLGLADLCRSTARFLGYYSSKAATSRDMRQRLMHFGSRLRHRIQ